MNILNHLAVLNWSVFVSILGVAFIGQGCAYAYVLSLDKGMIFERLGAWLSTGEKWKKPLGACAVCTSFWVTIFIGLILGVRDFNLIISALFAMYLINKL